MSTQPTALAQLRHLYQNMLNGGVRDTASAKRIAEGLLGPAIEALERGTPATGGEPVAYVEVSQSDAEVSMTWGPEPAGFNLPTGRYLLYTSPQPVREPLNIVELMRVVMKADEETRGNSLRGTTNWAAHIGKAVQAAVLAGGSQPVREPLTCEWSHNDDDSFWETSCGEAWRFDDGGPKENSMNFCHGCGKTLRITGGQT